MKTVRRSNRTPKPKGEVKVKIPKANSIHKKVEKTAANTSTDEVGSICKKEVSKKIKKLGTFVIHCDEVTGESQIDLDEIKTYLQGKIKVGGKSKDPRVKVEREDMKILIHADVFVERKYLKYLIKLFLKGKKLNNWIRIVNDGKRSYTLKYFRKD